MGWELKAGDMWALGVIAYVLVTGQAPFRGNSGRTHKEILKKIVNSSYKWPVGSKVSEKCRSFVDGLLLKQPTARNSRAPLQPAK